MQEWHVDQLHVAVYDTRAEAGAAAGRAAGEAIRNAIEKMGEARVILASAPSQVELLQALAEESVDWAKVTLFHMDEYLGFGPEHPASFRRFLLDGFLARVHPRAFEGLAGEAADPQQECARYGDLLAARPIDVVCLGIGENGHLAFNDPPVADFGDPALVKIVELDEACRRQQVNDGAFPDLESVPRRAITLTIPALVGALDLFCVVPGPRKAQAVRDTLHGEVTTACPASVLRRHSGARLYLDPESAALVER